MKKVLAVVLGVVMVLSVSFALVGCQSAADNIKDVTMTESQNGNVSEKHYQVNLNVDVDWAALSESEREDIAKAGFERVKDIIERDGIYQYQITGYAEGERPAFVYYRDTNELAILLDGAIVTYIAVEAPNIIPE